MGTKANDLLDAASELASRGGAKFSEFSTNSKRPGAISCPLRGLLSCGTFVSTEPIHLDTLQTFGKGSFLVYITLSGPGDLMLDGLPYTANLGEAMVGHPGPGVRVKPLHGFILPGFRGWLIISPEPDGSFPDWIPLPKAALAKLQAAIAATPSPVVEASDALIGAFRHVAAAAAVVPPHDELAAVRAGALTAEILIALYDLLVKTPDGETRLSWTESQRRVLAVARKLTMDFHKPFKIHDLAADAGLSPTEFTEVFTTVAGSTPRRYMNYLRLREAVRLLVETDTPEDKIAREIGFDGVSRFYGLFKEILHAKPSDFREKSNN